MNRKTIVVAAAAGALLVSAGSAWALGTGGDPVRAAATPTSATSTTSPTSSPISTPAAAQLTADDAARIVRARLGGGVVREVEAEFEHGRLEWKVDIVKDGVRYDIRIDAATGEVTRARADDRGGHGGDDPAGDDHGGHGGDDAPGDDHGGDR